MRTADGKPTRLFGIPRVDIADELLGKCDNHTSLTIPPKSKQTSGEDTQRLKTGIEDAEPGQEVLWAFDFLPKFADRLYWGFGWTTREILEEFEFNFPDIMPADIALSIIRREVGPLP